jgi:predicted metal-dependent hydrolase
MNAPLTPSQQRGIQVTPRLPDFSFGAEQDPDWAPGAPGLSAFCNTVSVVAGTAEGAFVEAGRWLMAQIADPAQREETRRFVQQEAFHATVHGRFNRALGATGAPVGALGALGAAVVDDLQASVGRVTWLAFALGTEQVIGEFGHAMLARPEPMGGMPEGPRQLFMWHCYEEVEHQAALHDGFEAVFGATRATRAQRVLGAAYAVATFTPPLLAGTWARLAPRHRWRPSVWWGLGRELVGPQGLFRGVPPALRALARVDFHPFDLHAPAETLARHSGLVDAAWARPPRVQPARDADAEECVPPVGLGDLARLVAFSLRTAARALAVAWRHG